MTNTNNVQTVVPKKIKDLFSFHPFGEAKVTGTPITNKNDITIKARTDACRVKRSIIFNKM